MKEYKIFIGGRFETTQEPLKIHNPYSGKHFASCYLAGKDELERAINAGIQAEQPMKDMPVFKKFESLVYISNRLKKERERLASVLAMESGKPIRYALGEIDRAAQTFLVAAEECKRLPGEYLSLDWTPPGAGKEGWVKFFPIGLVAGIAPFNFPMNLAVHKIAPAMAAGNPIILKPSRSTPLSVLELAAIMNETDFPEGSVSILPMDRDAGNQLVEDPRFKMLTFTGSPEVGWKMKREAGKKKVILELGGNAGVIVSESAAIDLAVDRCLVGGFAYSGQVCIHAQRIYVHEKIWEVFTEQFLHKVRQLKAGDPLDPATEVSVMIDRENAERVDAWVREAVNDGARILTGGKKKESFYEPTVLTQTQSSMKVCALEVFGPVVILEPISDFDSGIDAVNTSRYGLQAGVFTNDLSEMNRAFEILEVGGVIVNDVPTFRVDHMPYGGIRDSGFGREGLKYTIREMMEPKLLVKNK